MCIDWFVLLCDIDWPRLPNSDRITVPSSLTAGDGEKDDQQEGSEVPASQRHQPKQQQSTRRLNPSVRLVLSQSEVEGNAISHKLLS